MLVARNHYEPSKIMDIQEGDFAKYGPKIWAQIGDPEVMAVLTGGR